MNRRRRRRPWRPPSARRRVDVDAETLQPGDMVWVDPQVWSHLMFGRVRPLRLLATPERVHTSDGVAGVLLRLDAGIRAGYFVYLVGVGYKVTRDRQELVVEVG